VIVKGIQMSGAHGMPEGAELALGSLELEVDTVMPAEHFRCSAANTAKQCTPGQRALSGLFTPWRLDTRT